MAKDDDGDRSRTETSIMAAHAATLTLLAARTAGATMCPSEVARALAASAASGIAATNWRALMPAVHAAVDRLVADGAVQLSWKGVTRPSRAGPYRIGRRAPGA